jgi:hypothetical protein
MQKTIETGDVSRGHHQSGRGRRFLQFKLRSILVLTGLVGVALACWQQLIEPFRFYQSTAKAIVEAGGHCQVASVVPAWLRGKFGGEWEEIVSVDLPKPEITALFLSELPRLKSLRELTVSGAHFGDNQLSALRTLAHLRQLTLRGTSVTPERVAQLTNERPELCVTIEPLEITFEEDLRFVQPPDQPFDRSLLNPRIHGLNGSRVRIQGFLHHTAQRGISQAYLDHALPWT